MLLAVAQAVVQPLKIAEEASHALTQRELIDGFADLGHGWAIDVKLDAFQLGERGYECNPEAARNYIEELLDRDNENKTAIRYKIDGLCTGRYGYDQNHEAARHFIEDLVGQQNDVAISYKIDGLCIGRFGYERNHEAAKMLIEELLGRNNKNENETVIDYKITGLRSGHYNYNRDLEAAKIFTDQMIDLGSEVAIGRKLHELISETCDSNCSNPEAAREFNDQMIAKGSQLAEEEKAYTLVCGGAIYPQDFGDATRFLNELSQLSYVLKKKIMCYSVGTYVPVEFRFIN